MTLFLLISCNTSGKNLTDDEVAKSDGTVIDLAKITKNIKDSVAFARSVTEVHSLVKSIDELAKAIGKKIQDQDTLADDANHNGGIIAGSFQIISTVKSKLGILSKTNELSDELRQKVNTAEQSSKKFLDKLKEKKDDLGKDAASDEDAKKAIDRVNKADGDKGVAELIALNTAIDALLTAANAAVESAINELTTSVKPSN
ncbi:Vsp/OspC family lipoprotein (plasmid) [Borrelia puertoricensis]